MINIEELKIEFEGTFYDDDESTILIVSKNEIWEWIKNKVQQQVSVEPVVKVQIAKMFNDLFDKYKAEKTSVIHSYDEFYQNGLADGKLIALAEIKEAFSNLSA